jgi:hypothetical protein
MSLMDPRKDYSSFALYRRDASNTVYNRPSRIICICWKIWEQGDDPIALIIKLSDNNTVLELAAKASDKDGLVLNALKAGTAA